MIQHVHDPIRMRCVVVRVAQHVQESWDPKGSIQFGVSESW